jgi:mannitol-1-phosphate/altronate dehydrogenase
VLHIHFGTGRLGLGLVAPFFQSVGSELYLLNRSRSASNDTGQTQLTPERRAELLRNNPKRRYYIQTPSKRDGVQETVHYDGFMLYDEDNIEECIERILERSCSKQDGVIVTASVLKVENYGPILRAINVVCTKKETEQTQIGRIFLVACENTVSAHDIWEASELCDLVNPRLRRHLTCVHALVDRMCVGLEEYWDPQQTSAHPAVLVRAEEYGSVKLELRPETQDLIEICHGSRIEFSAHIDTEKKIKGWLLNGTHWLIALTAFQASAGDTQLKLNEYLAHNPERKRFARKVIQEIRDGVEIVLRRDPEYSDFVRAVPVNEYLDRASDAILARFCTTEDSIARILARFRRPCPEQVSTIESFAKRFFDRVNPAIAAYESVKGVPPPATSRGLLSLWRLVAAGTFVDSRAA